ncbi:Transmembrane protein [Trichoderma lentiforme]|uniref:Transmembrane protein n=1 Tax=Trichoderma lentiforme TaxID=1567552 RepID=A0A9P5CET5_9HYPO|nr:Transmembrane protein [Trichoderma lentiforme]
MSSPEEPPTARPPAINYVLSFILVGLAWGLTTPFIRRAARTHKPAPHPLLDSPAVKQSWLRSRLYAAFFSVLDLLRNPRYAVPLVLNLTGSVWFFLLIGKAVFGYPLELSLTVPIVNAMAFLFTVVGEWLVEGKGLGEEKETGIGMTLSLVGIALCVQSKT